MTFVVGGPCPNPGRIKSFIISLGWHPTCKDHPPLSRARLFGQLDFRSAQQRLHKNYDWPELLGIDGERGRGLDNPWSTEYGVEAVFDVSTQLN